MHEFNDNPFKQYDLAMSSGNNDEFHRTKVLVNCLIERGYLSLDGLNAATALFQNNSDSITLTKILEEIHKQNHKDSNSIAHLARLKLSLGLPKESFLLVSERLSEDPENQHLWSLCSRSIQLLDTKGYQPALISLFKNMLKQPAVNAKTVSPAVMRALHWHPLWQQALTLVENKAVNPATTIELMNALSHNELFIDLIKISTVTSIDAEKVITHLRRNFLRDKSSIPEEKVSLTLLCAIAEQCFFNEFVYSIVAEELPLIENLEKEIPVLWEKSGSPPLILIALLGCYKPLYNYKWTKNLLKRSYEKVFSDLVLATIKNPLEELEIKSTIPTLKLLDNEVSNKVRAQYEDSPYPRWKSGGFLPSSTTIKKALKIYDINTENIKNTRLPSILIAGCGTGHQVLQTASRFLYSQITAIDLSKSSLAYAIRKTNELGYPKITYMHSDILCVAELEKQFDMIECRGVLHHMDEPFAGLEALTTVLKPNGVMKLGLYSEAARTSIVEEHKKIKKMKRKWSDEKIRNYRKSILQKATKNENGVSVHSNPIVSTDFFSMSECRDLLFHSKEHRLNLQQIAETLDNLKLTFLGFEISAQIRQKFLSSRSHNSDLYSLSAWHEYEVQNPNTFANMYEFWVQKRNFA